MKFFFLITLWLLAGCGLKHKTLFRELSPDQSGINFSNDIIENQELNVLNYEYIYNGSGVGIGDVNNDGLPDIYFTGNRVSNKLYLNKGKLRFEDITSEASVDGLGKWSKGVSIIDINNDGWMDIYVCAAVLPDQNMRKNMLYINQGNQPSSKKPVFKEMAAAYGLDDASSSQMAAFFDYDNDGDLDVYLLVNDLDGTYPNEFREIHKDGSWPNTDKLFENNYDENLKHPVFTDVSKKAGIVLEGYGLGLSIADINNDGWKDIYVSNDYVSNNIWYINNRNGSFTDQCSRMLKHTSRNAMGNDIADINNDGLADLIELDMMPADNYRQKMMFSNISYQTFQNTEHYGYMYQYPRNSFQLNRGMAGDSLVLPVFSEIAYFSGIAHTDWSWAPLLADMDNDGYRDLMISNGLPHDMSDLDFMAYRKNAVEKTPLDEVLKQLPTLKINNYIFRNNHDLSFTDMSRQWGWTTPTYSTGMAYADFDLDGDLDIVVNNTNMIATFLENRSNENKDKNLQHYLRIRLKGDEKNIQGIGSTIHIYANNQHQVNEFSPYRGYLSSVENIIHFGLGGSSIVDSVIINWPNNKRQVLTQVKTDQTIVLEIRNASVQSSTPKRIIESPVLRDITASIGKAVGFAEVDFIDFNIQRMIPHKLTQYGPSVAVGDLNADGQDDMVIGGSSPFYASVLMQQQNGSFNKKWIIDPKQPQLQDDAGMSLFDADGDGDLDLYIASGGAENEPQSKPYTDHFFLNDGKGNFTEMSIAVTNNRASKSCIATHDYDGDGDLDLFIGGRVIPGKYPLPTSSFIYRNDSKNGKIGFTDVTRIIAPELQNVGMVTSAVWSDADGDGKMELMITAEWGYPMIFSWQNGGYKQFFKPLKNLTGFWNSILPADIDNDGDMDYMLGNFGTNGYLKPTPKYPLKAYVLDFDKNGSLDAVFSSWQRTSLSDTTYAEFPLAGRDEFLREISAMKERFPNYSSYAKATIAKSFSPEQLKAATTFSVTEFRNGWIENKGKLEFTFHPFPKEAQFAPVYGILARDIDNDGYLDLILNGNEYSMAPSLGRYDAFCGLMMKGDGKGSFISKPLNQSGFFVNGNGKSLTEIKHQNGLAIVALENIGSLKLFASSQVNKRIEKISPDETHAIIYFKNGQKRREEFPRGSGFLTQSTRYFQWTGQEDHIEIFHRNGEIRTKRP